MKSSIPFQPRLHLGMLVRRIIVHDQVQIQLRRGFGVDLFQKLSSTFALFQAVKWPELGRLVVTSLKAVVVL
jgi:hypothetical protein